jgi:hypothetical protein
LADDSDLIDPYSEAREARLYGRSMPVLVVFGGSHLSSQWRALDGALGSPTLIGRG